MSEVTGEKRQQPVVLTVDPDRLDEAVIEQAAAVLRDGGLVAFPTETVYGLGADALSEEAVEKIFEAKGRPATNPLIVHVADIDGARRLTNRWTESAQKLAESFWPGPLTLVLNKAEIVPDAVCAGLGTVAVRLPADPVARALIEKAGVPVAAPSANRYTRVSPTTARHVVEGLGDRVEVVLDAGPTTVGVESTLVSLAQQPPEILRPGMITHQQLQQVVQVRPHRGSVVDEAEARPSPGMAKRHYSPGATVRVVDEAAFRQALETSSESRGFIGFSTGDMGDGPRRVRLSLNPEQVARRLYAVLHRLDAVGVDEIIVECPPEGDRWEAIRDRLRRAAASVEDCRLE